MSLVDGLFGPDDIQYIEGLEDWLADRGMYNDQADYDSLVRFAMEGCQNCENAGSDFAGPIGAIVLSDDGDEDNDFKFFGPYRVWVWCLDCYEHWAWGRDNGCDCPCSTIKGVADFRLPFELG